MNLIDKSKKILGKKRNCLMVDNVVKHCLDHHLIPVDFVLIRSGAKQKTRSLILQAFYYAKCGDDVTYNSIKSLRVGTKGWCDIYVIFQEKGIRI